MADAPAPDPDELLRDLPDDAPVGPVIQGQAPEVSKSGLLRSGAIVTAITALANGLNVVFHFSVARFLEPDEYALLTTIFAVTAIATVPLLAVQSNVARELSILLGKDETQAAAVVLRAMFALVARFALGVCLLLALLAWPAIEVLHIERPLPILATALAIVVAVPIPAAWGALQASERFTALSVNQATAPFFKLLFGVGLAALGFGASAITFGVAAATLIALMLALRALRPLLDAAPRERLRIQARRLIGGYALGAAVCLTTFTALIQTDVIWARATLSPSAAGDYAAASVMTSFVLLVPVGVTTVLFPRIARMGEDPAGRRPLVVGLAAVGGLSLFFLAAFAIAPKLLLELAFGNDYDGAAPWLLPLGVAMAAYGLVAVYLNHFLAQGRTQYVAVLLTALVLQQIAFLLFSGSGWRIVWVQVTCSLATVLASEVFERRARGLVARRASAT